MEKICLGSSANLSQFHRFGKRSSIIFILIQLGPSKIINVNELDFSKLSLRCGESSPLLRQDPFPNVAFFVRPKTMRRSLIFFGMMCFRIHLQTMRDQDNTFPNQK